MPIIFPSFDITGIRPSRWYAAPLDYPKITQSFEFEDGGKGFNEVADNAPRHWEYGHTGLSFADAQQFDDFYNLVRLSQPFDFKDKYGVVWHNVYIESYTRNHDAHKSWSITVTFHLVNYDGTFTPAPMVPGVPTGLRLTVLSDTSILAEWDAPPDTTAPTVPVMSAASVISDTEIDWSWSAASDAVGVTGYDLEVATDAGFTTGLVTHNLGNVLVYSSTGLTASTTYYARVRAHDAVPNNSAYSSSVNGTTDSSGPDADATAFLTASGNSGDATISAAINQLVIDLKAAGVWAKCTGIYPFVGGTAAKHKWNLKDPRDLDAAFRLIFNGSFTHDANGITPGGTTSDYVDTKKVANSASTTDFHWSFYSRTNVDGLYADFGPDEIMPRFSNTFYSDMPDQGGGDRLTTALSDSRGFFNGSLTPSDIVVYRNGANLVTKGAVATNTAFLGSGALNFTYCSATLEARPSPRNLAFTSFGLALTTTQQAAFYTAVQAFQVALSRSV